MKKFLFILSAGVIVLISSCGSKKEEGGMSATAKKNLEANNAILKSFESGDWSKVDEYIAKDVVDHAGPTGDIVGIDNMKAYFKEMSEKMTNMKNDVVKTLADDEYVMAWVKGTATAKVDMREMGMKSGETHAMTSVEVSKFKDGKAVEHWSFVNPAEMMEMMMKGNPAGPAPSDTTKMQ